MDDGKIIGIVYIVTVCITVYTLVGYWISVADNCYDFRKRLPYIFMWPVIIVFICVIELIKLLMNSVRNTFKSEKKKDDEEVDKWIL